MRPKKPMQDLSRWHGLLLAIAMAAGTAVGCARQDVAVDEVQAVAATPAASGETNPSQIHGTGIVIRILPDDRDGSPHQRFILRLPSGQTLLVAHNIDLAPPISNLRVGDTVEYSGEYAWNPKGGVVHWTHRDPSRQHVDGWLKHDGHVYQ